MHVITLYYYTVITLIRDKRVVVYSFEAQEKLSVIWKTTFLIVFLDKISEQVYWNFIPVGHSDD